MAYSILRRDDEQPDYSDGVYASQTAEAMDKADRLMKQEAERRARAEEEARARIAASNDNATAQGGTSPGGNFGSSFSQFAGGGAASSMTPTAAAQASGTVGAHAAPYAGANAAGAGGSLTGTSAAGGGSSWLGGLYANPYAWIAALAIGNELNADHEGRRDMDSFTGESAITGRSFYRDRDHMREQGNKIFDGWGDDIGIAANFSSPIDLFRGDTWSDAWDSAKRGGTLGGIIRKIF